MARIRIGIYGYGNLGRGVERAVAHAQDMELCAIFTRRDPALIRPLDPSTPAAAANDAVMWRDKLDVMIVCGGSAADLPVMTPALAADFSVVDSFDTHARIPAHFDAVERAALTGGRLALISAGWDPGLFSVERLMGECILPGSRACTFYGRGVSQGHSDAVRRIPGVADARQYTVPNESAMYAVRSGRDPGNAPLHRRECFVVLSPGADPDAVENAIVTMPYYFSGCNTTVHFISQAELDRDHNELPHGGFVIRRGAEGAHESIMEYRLTLGSNPEFTGAVLTACARAVYRMHARGRRGCITVFDVAPADLSPYDARELMERML